MSKFNKLSIAVFVTTLTVTMFTWYMLGVDCEEVGCLYDKKISFFAPLYFGVRWLALITFALLFVSAITFKKWLLYIALPVILITMLLVGNISVYSDGIIKLSRSDMAQLGMQGLAIITVIFLLVQRYVQKRKQL